MQKETVITIVIFIALAVIGVYFSLRKGYEETVTKTNVYENDDTKDNKVVAEKRYKKAENVLIAGKDYSAVMKTSKGDITLDLFEKETPVTVNNFVFLARDDFYDNTRFHRIIKDFMIQGGDPLGTGMGGPGYKFNDEPITKDYVRGVIAMANSGPNTNGSQFFIMHKDTPLPKNYVIFGIVTKGLDVVDKIAETPVRTSPSGETSDPREEVTITSIEITTN